MTVDEITGSLSPETDLRHAAKLKVKRHPRSSFRARRRSTQKFVLTPEAGGSMVAKDPASKASSTLT